MYTFVRYLAEQPYRFQCKHFTVAPIRRVRVEFDDAHEASFKGLGLHVGHFEEQQCLGGNGFGASQLIRPKWAAGAELAAE